MGYGSAVALGRALEYVNELGVDRVLAHDQALAARLADGLRSLGATVLTPEDDAHRGGIVTARYPGRDGEEVAGAAERRRGDRLAAVRRDAVLAPLLQRRARRRRGAARARHPALNPQPVALQPGCEQRRLAIVEQSGDREHLRHAGRPPGDQRRGHLHRPRRLGALPHRPRRGARGERDVRLDDGAPRPERRADRRAARRRGCARRAGRLCGHRPLGRRVHDARGRAPDGAAADDRGHALARAHAAGAPLQVRPLRADDGRAHRRRRPVVVRTTWPASSIPRTSTARTARCRSPRLPSARTSTACRSSSTRRT